jgi:hypothetical protein
LHKEGSPHCMTSSNEFIDPLYDNPRQVDEITLHDLESGLLVTEEQIVQVLTREERPRGIVDGFTSTQLRIIKEALEKMKSDYL